MGVRILSMVSGAKQILKLQSLTSRGKPEVPKGHAHCSLCLREREAKRFVVPISVVNHPSFKEMFKRAEEEFGFDHPMGRLTIPCKEDAFIDLTSRLHS